MARAFLLLLVLVASACGRPEAERPTSPPAPGPTPGHGPDDTVPDLPGPEACAAARLFTLEELARGEGRDQHIAVDATPMASSWCEEMFCQTVDGERPACCNQCSGGYELRLERALIIELVGAGSCSGYDCGYHCEPFGRMPTTRYRFAGTYQITGGSPLRAQLTIEAICSLPTE